MAVKRKYVIIDPASPEFNRGSFCYLPYILFNALWSRTNDLVELKEDFTVAEMDNLPTADFYMIALWSYPQIEACLTLYRFLPRRKVLFFGYYPLIDHLGLPKYVVPTAMITEGCLRYPYEYPRFKHLLLSDCDMHLTKYGAHKVVPLFASYGCPRGCAFCPSTVNTGRSRLEFPVQDVKEMLTRCNYMNYLNIHFTDEDWFFDTERSFELVDWIIKSGLQRFNFIALSEVKSLLRFIRKYGVEMLLAAGFKLVEVGFETADPELGRSMGKAPVDRCRELAELCKGKLDLFWLNLTFFPGETLTTLRETGDFMRQYGLKYEEVSGRIRTNGTEGGLGQFFQPYHGTRNYDKLEHRGVFLTERPVRLLPSYLPDSFLDQRIKVVRQFGGNNKKWLELYNVWVGDTSVYLRMYEGRRVRDAVKPGVSAYNDSCDAAITIAIAAKLGIIEEG